MDTKAILKKHFIDQRDKYWPDSKAQWENGTTSCDVIKTRRTTESMIDINTGRMDPDKFEVRALVEEIGDVIVGRTVRVDGDDCNIDQINPDSIGVTVTMIMRKRKISGQ